MFTWATGCLATGVEGGAGTRPPPPRGVLRGRPRVRAPALARTCRSHRCQLVAPAAFTASKKVDSKLTSTGLEGQVVLPTSPHPGWGGGGQKGLRRSFASRKRQRGHKTGRGMRRNARVGFHQDGVLAMVYRIVVLFKLQLSHPTFVPHKSRRCSCFQVCLLLHCLCPAVLCARRTLSCERWPVVKSV